MPDLVVEARIIAGRAFISRIVLNKHLAGLWLFLAELNLALHFENLCRTAR